jgi:hypothetical protein
MLNHARRHGSRMLAVLFVVTGYLFWECDTRAQSGLPSAEEPWLAEPGDWAADFNQAQVACYRGSMRACDSIWLSRRVLMDTWLYSYGRTCGGRVSLDELRSAGAFRLGGPSLHSYGNLSRVRIAKSILAN